MWTDLIETLVIVLEALQQIVMSSGALKIGILDFLVTSLWACTVDLLLLLPLDEPYTLRETRCRKRCGKKMDIKKKLMKAIEDARIKPCLILVWIGIPSAGGTTWSYVNFQHKSVRLKVQMRWFGPSTPRAAHTNMHWQHDLAQLQW